MVVVSNIQEFWHPNPLALITLPQILCKYWLLKLVYSCVYFARCKEIFIVFRVNDIPWGADSEIYSSVVNVLHILMVPKRISFCVKPVFARIKLYKSESFTVLVLPREGWNQAWKGMMLCITQILKRQIRHFLPRV